MTAARWRRVVAVAALVASVAVLAGCGSSSLSDGQLRARATRICAEARTATAKIATPSQPSEGAPFLNRGVAALAPELLALQRLRPPDGIAGSYHDALVALSDEITSLRSTVKGLRAGNDPIVAIKTLQSELAPVEKQASDAWAAVGVPSCASG
jgi:outer membrane murein-binding lipoprotein Lpp